MSLSEAIIDYSRLFVSSVLTINIRGYSAMPFDRGSFTFAMFDIPEKLPENFISQFATRRAGTLDSVTDEPQIGWVTGFHLLDTVISEESAQMGGCYYLALRQAVRKIPTTLLNAVCKREEQAYMRANNLEYVSSKMKKQIREEAIEKHILKMPPTLSGIPMVLEPHERLLYVGASSRRQLDQFIEFFFQTLKIEPVQLSPALLLERIGGITEASFPSLNIGGQPDATPVIGRDFLMWLWFYSETKGKLEVPDYGEFELMIEAPLVLVSSGDAQGSEEVTVKKGDSPLRSSEAKAAMLSGKKLRKAKLTMTRANQIWTGSFDADQFAFGSFKTPEPEEMNADEIFAERVRNLAIFRSGLMMFFKKFCETMTGKDFLQFQKEILAWARERDAV